MGTLNVQADIRRRLEEALVRMGKRVKISMC